MGTRTSDSATLARPACNPSGRAHPHRTHPEGIRMTVLGEQARARVAAQWQRENTTPVAFTKPDLAAAIAATDDWIEANTASFNQALPQPFRSSATTAQKSEIFAYVLWRRIGRLRAAEDDA